MKDWVKIMCEICRTYPCISPLCPNYEPPKAVYYCSSCGQGIYEGEDYIVNDNGDYRHYDCFFGMKELLEWLGYEIKTMENYYEEY